MVQLYGKKASDGFQSLFLWNSPSEIWAYPHHEDFRNVSILVFVELALGDQETL